MSRRKLSLSRSSLANPQTPIHALAVRFQEFLHFPDPEPLYVTIGVMAANMLRGDSVWLMLVGPPSCGKTQLLMTLSCVPGVLCESKLKGEAALLSASRKKEWKNGAKGGLLREIGDRGAIIFKDFTSILSMQKDSMVEVIAALRETFDGQWTRRVGAEGAMSLRWTGKVGILAGVTPAIDRSHAMVTEMGERFVFYRYSDSDGWAESMQALARSGNTQLAHEIALAVRDFYDCLGLGWSLKAYPEQGTRQLKHSEAEGIVAMGQLSAMCRGLVLRDPYTREINDVPVVELPPRLVTSLNQLYLAMEFVGVESGVGGEAWNIIRKIALDSMPMTRSIALKCAIHGSMRRTSAGEVAHKGRFSDGTAKRALEDLAALGAMRRADNGGWELSERAVELAKRVKA